MNVASLLRWHVYALDRHQQGLAVLGDVLSLRPYEVRHIRNGDDGAFAIGLKIAASQPNLYRAPFDSRAEGIMVGIPLQAHI